MWLLIWWKATRSKAESIALFQSHLQPEKNLQPVQLGALLKFKSTSAAACAPILRRTNSMPFSESGVFRIILRVFWANLHGIWGSVDGALSVVNRSKNLLTAHRRIVIWNLKACLCVWNTIRPVARSEQPKRKAKMLIKVKVGDLCGTKTQTHFFPNDLLIAFLFGNFHHHV